MNNKMLVIINDTTKGHPRITFLKYAQGWSGADMESLGESITGSSWSKGVHETAYLVDFDQCSQEFIQYIVENGQKVY